MAAAPAGEEGVLPESLTWGTEAVARTLEAVESSPAACVEIKFRAPHAIERRRPRGV